MDAVQIQFLSRVKFRPCRSGMGIDDIAEDFINIADNLGAGRRVPL
jgi:hypothetical protein